MRETAGTHRTAEMSLPHPLVPTNPEWKQALPAGLAPNAHSLNYRNLPENLGYFVNARKS
jgi:hypothetical protein